MVRKKRICPAGFIFHCLNRASNRQTIFDTKEDFDQFEKVLEQAHRKIPLKILDYTVMPNHWHFVVQPEDDSQVTDFFHWLTGTHTMRYHYKHESNGTGHLYQGRFKSFPVQSDSHLLTVLRYVERNPVRAGLSKRVQDWQWGSAWRREYGNLRQKQLLSEWPLDIPKKWLDFVNKPLTQKERKELRECIEKGKPYGKECWATKSANLLQLQQTMRPRGRPKKKEA